MDYLRDQGCESDLLDDIDDGIIKDYLEEQGYYVTDEEPDDLSVEELLKKLGEKINEELEEKETRIRQINSACNQLREKLKQKDRPSSDNVSEPALVPQDVPVSE